MKTALLTVLSFLLLQTMFSYAQNNPDDKGNLIAIYADTGAWADGIVALENFLNWKGLPHNRIYASDVNALDLKNYYKGIIVPGGYAYNYDIKINSMGRHHIRDLISTGGGYLGICAGSFYASSTVHWEGTAYTYNLGLFKGTAKGPLFKLAPWPTFDMTTISLTQYHPINQYEDSVMTVLYFGGPVFIPDTSQKITTVATYDSAANKKAAIAFKYNMGRVVLIGPHPEIEEDSDRDSTSTCDYLNDNGSDWNWLSACIDWVYRKPIQNTYTKDVLLSADRNKSLPVDLKVYPNPVVDQLTVNAMYYGRKLNSVDVLNLNGQLLQSFECQTTDNYLVIDLTDFGAACYFLRIQFDNEIVYRKIIVQ